MLIDLSSIATVATGRQASLFAADLRERAAELRAVVGARRVLAIGGAGSLGSATVRELAALKPASLHVVDQNENSLAELVRDLRSGRRGLAVRDFRALPLDYGAPVMLRFLRDSGPYDLILNFAALKHVRSEKDVYSLVQLLDTNVVKQVRFLGWLQVLGSDARYFCVSTDKAANPVNLMGASKRLMEHVMFSAVAGSGGIRTSARFANVAFSAGSLLEGFLRRLEKRQPMAAPRATRRYFVSLEEAGQICLLAAALGPDRHVLVPRLDPDNLRELESVAVALLQQMGLRPHLYDDEQAARASVEEDLARGQYPLLLTPLDTAGEKPYEEFVAEGEEAVELGFATLRGVRYRPGRPDALAELLGRLESLASGGPYPAKEEIVSWIASVVPEFRHAGASKQLDERM